LRIHTEQKKSCCNIAPLSLYDASWTSALSICAATLRQFRFTILHGLDAIVASIPKEAGHTKNLPFR
jgi:hypothetical protein